MFTDEMRENFFHQNENPEVAASGFSIPFLRWLMPQADCSLLSPIQPFTDDICYNTSHDRRKK